MDFCKKRKIDDGRTFECITGALQRAGQIDMKTAQKVKHEWPNISGDAVGLYHTCSVCGNWVDHRSNKCDICDSFFTLLS